MESDKRSTESKSMFSVVERVNAGYEKFFDSKPKPSGARSECYSNFLTCGSASNNMPDPKVAVEKTEEANPEIDQNVVQQFFPEQDEPKQQREVVDGSGCCKYLPVKKEK